MHNVVSVVSWQSFRPKEMSQRCHSQGLCIVPSTGHLHLCIPFCFFCSALEPPTGYPQYSHNQWMHLLVSSKRTNTNICCIEFMFIHLLFSFRTECSFDYVEVFDGNSSSKSLGRYCSGSFRTFISSTNMLTVLFHSDISNTHRGFNAIYSTYYWPHGE